MKVVHLLQNIEYDLHNGMQEVWSPVCARNSTTSPQPNEQTPIQHCPWCINDSCVAPHFTSEGQSESDLSVMIIDRCWKEDSILRKVRENRWIRMLDTASLEPRPSSYV